jgi:nitroreductase
VTERANDRGALAESLSERFNDGTHITENIDKNAISEGTETLSRMARRGSLRRFAARPVAPALLRLLSAVALASPTKSDLQQRDIVIVTDDALRAALNALIADQAWTAAAPALLVFCGNNRRQRMLHGWRGHPFANDHLDAFFNAAVDAGIALSAFVIAAESVGLGCCPISALRNEADEVSRLLRLPDHVFPVAGLAVGWPASAPEITPRLPLSLTLHENHYAEPDIEAAVAHYDRSRRYTRQRDVARFGTAAAYGWSEDKARQYAKPERSGFGAFVRRKGFRLD